VNFWSFDFEIAPSVVLDSVHSFSELRDKHFDFNMETEQKSRQL